MPSWTGNKAVVPKGSILVPVLLLVYIDDLADGLSWNANLFADNEALFSVIHNFDTYTNELNNYLYKVNNWVYQWKMSFHPHPSKQVHGIILNRKTKKISHPSLRFNNSVVLKPILCVMLN